jgi:ubiquinol-cytochrome c reductase cytochrome c1 subunit
MIRRFVLCAALLFATPFLVPAASAQEAEETKLLDAHFSFDSLFGTIDLKSAQRGLQIYKEVCSACHGLYELSYRNLAALGYNDEEIKAFAAAYTVPDVKDDGSPGERPAKGSDKFVRPFPNEKAARAANNGGYPPDLALIVKARKGGANYVYSIMQGYQDPPPDVKISDTAYYNIYFPGHQIAMPPPLQDGSVTFADGTKNDLAQEAHDVATFLEWASNPELAERKQMGINVLIFLVILSVVLYVAKRRIWKDVH